VQNDTRFLHPSSFSFVSLIKTRLFCFVFFLLNFFLSREDVLVAFVLVAGQGSRTELGPRSLSKK
jgi:hypothetical protein